MIFKHICKKDNKYLTKIIFKESENWKWATTTEAVYNYAKKNFKDGDTVDVEYNVKNGQYFVSKIMKPGTGKAKTKESPKRKENSKPTCADCGKELKDGSYEKCYTCNKKNPSEKKSSPEKAEAIARQNANHATSRALIALQGQIDINNIYEISKQLHEHFLRLAKGEEVK